MGTSIIDICGDGKTGNTGAKNQRQIGVIKSYILATDEQKFTNLTEFKTEANWLTAKQNKDIVVMYEASAPPEDTSTEDTYYESRGNKVRTDNGRPALAFKHDLDSCSYKALKSYENSKYTRIYEVTRDGYIVGVANADGSIQGKRMKNFIVGPFKSAGADSLSNATAEVIYKDEKEAYDNTAIVTPLFDIGDLEGIYDIELEIVSASATEIVVKAKAGCCGLDVTSFTGTDWKLLTTAGATQAITADSHANGQYTLTGTGWVTGTLELNGVISQPGIMYETPVKAIVTIS